MVSPGALILGRVIDHLYRVLLPPPKTSYSKISGPQGTTKISGSDFQQKQESSFELLCGSLSYPIIDFSKTSKYPHHLLFQTNVILVETGPDRASASLNTSLLGLGSSPRALSYLLPEKLGGFVGFLVENMAGRPGCETEASDGEAASLREETQTAIITSPSLQEMTSFWWRCMSWATPWASSIPMIPRPSWHPSTSGWTQRTSCYLMMTAGAFSNFMASNLCPHLLLSLCALSLSSWPTYFFPSHTLQSPYIPPPCCLYVLPPLSPRFLSFLS